jgi:class 3 adenylate cyclase
VLFADLSGFTTLSERIDPQDVCGFQGDFFGEMARAVERYKGFVEKFVGDAVMAMLARRNPARRARAIEARLRGWMFASTR